MGLRLRILCNEYFSFSVFTILIKYSILITFILKLVATIDVDDKQTMAITFVSDDDKHSVSSLDDLSTELRRRREQTTRESETENMDTFRNTLRQTDFKGTITEESETNSDSIFGDNTHQSSDPVSLTTKTRHHNHLTSIHTRHTTSRRHTARHAHQHTPTYEGQGHIMTSEVSDDLSPLPNVPYRWVRVDPASDNNTSKEEDNDSNEDLVGKSALQLTATSYPQNASLSPRTHLGTHHSLRISINRAPALVEYEDQYVVIEVNCSLAKDNGTSRTKEATGIGLLVRVTSTKTRVVIPYALSQTNKSSRPKTLDHARGILAFSMDCLHNPSVFGLYINNVGRARVRLQFATGGGVSGSGKVAAMKSTESQELYSSELEVAVLRRVRPADLAFDCVMPLVLLLVAFSTGAATDVTQLRTHVRQPAPVVIALVCQLLILPMATVGVAALFIRDTDLALGLLLVATAPGGGGGHLMVVIAGGDIPLSLLLNFAAITFTLASAPLWLLGWGLVTGDHTHIAYDILTLWISVTIVIYFLGICLRKRSEAFAEGLLNWLTKPFILLASILYITLGIFTNTYLFLVLNLKSFIVIVIYSSLCFCIAFFVPFLLQQSFALCKTIASHCAVPHCLLSIVLSRYALSQPVADVASVAPILLLIFSYVPFLIELIFRIVRKLIRERFEKIEEEKEQRSGSSSRLNISKVNSNSGTQLESCSHTSMLTQVTQTEGYKSMAVHEQVTAV